MQTKTDARGITITYQYDALNRNRTVNYSNTTVNPDITRVYDTATNGRGRLHYSYAGGDATNGNEVELTKIDSYDALGRPTTLTQQFKVGGVWSGLYQSTRGYNLAGGVRTQSYPSVHTVSYSFDDAGRTNAFSGDLGDGVQRTYSTGIIYSPLGGMTKEEFGTDTALFNKAWYNSRGQLSEIRVSTSYTGPLDTSWNRGSIINHYSNQCWGMCGGANSTMAMVDNDGNLKKQHVDIPKDEGISSYISYTSWFSYDSLNRLQEVHGERWDSGTSVVSDYWKQSYLFDRYGNRRIDTNPSATYGYGINNKDFTVNTTNNRLGVPSGQTGVMSYDAAGNLTNDTYTGVGARNYDAENRMISANGGINGQLQYYTYNADGQRTRRKIDGVETWQIYGFDGELLAEYAPNGAGTSPQKEYGYRNGQLLITAEPSGAPSGPQNVSWTNVATTVQVTGNSLQKVSGGASWNDAGAVSTQAIPAGEGYVEFTPGNTVTNRMIGLGNGNSSYHYADIEFAFYVSASGLRIYEAGTDRGSFGTYTSTDRLRVGVEGGVVKYRKNGVLLYTSTVAPVYPLLVDASLNTVNSELIDVVISGAPGGGSPLSFVTSKTLGAQRADSPGWTGFKMTTGAQPVTVTTLGRLCVAAGNSGTHELRLIRVSDNSVVASVNVSMSGCTVGQFKYATLANPLTLLASTAYLLVSYEVGTDTFHDWTGTVLTTTSVATVNHGVYTTNGGQTWGPAGSTGNSYVPVDFQYTVSTAANINWLVTDQLGTPRMVFDKTGSLATVKRHDYLPFGEELFAGAAGRTLADGYVGDNVRQKFTRKERDIETGLDYFLARYHSSSQGRFTSPDPLITSGKVVVPQSWNRYTYCLNNPLAFIDPSGLEWRRNDETGALRWYEKDDDRTGTTEYTNEYYQAPDGQWVHLNMSGPTRNAEDAAFARRGWDFVDAASVPGIYNGANMPSMQAGRGDSTGALQLLFEWVTGTGPTDREFGPSDYMTQGIMTSPDIAAARQAFIDQGGGTYMGGVRFGLNAEDGPFEAGLNMPRQFVGSFNITITEQRNGDAHFVLENATTLKSALYQFPGVQPVERSTMRPLSTKTQTYWWIERGVIKR